MKKLSFLIVAISLLTFFFSVNLYAGGGGSYPNGSEAFMSGAVPPPGLYFTNYFYYYYADEMKDDDGDNIDAFDKVSVIADVLRFIYITDKKVLGGNYGQHLFIPFINTQLDFNAKVGPDSDDSYSDTNIPYLIYSPFLLSHHFMKGKLHTVVSLVDIYIPFYNQEDDNLAYAGQNFWTFEPVVGVTYLPGNFEFSIKAMYDFNTKQEDYPTVYGVNVDRKPGQEFHFDYSASYAITKNLRLGISGYYYRQMTDDDFDIDSNIAPPVQELLRQDEGNRSRVFAVGPGVQYKYKNMFFELRSQWEMEARNKTEGQANWFKFTYAF